MKKLILKHLVPNHFDHYSLLSMTCGLIVILSPFMSCGPSKAELEAKERQGFTWDSKMGAFVQTGIDSTQNDDSENSRNRGEEFKIKTIDNCEYIILKEYPITESDWSGSQQSANVAIIHKANCSNPIH